MIALRVAKGVRTHFVERLPEWFLAWHIGFVGAQLVRSDRVFLTSPAYRIIAQFVTEMTWGATALGLSLFWLTALILNGSVSWFALWSRWVRSLSAFAVSGFWAVAAVGNGFAAPFTPALINSAAFAMMAFAVSLITAGEVGAAGKRSKNAASRKR